MSLLYSHYRNHLLLLTLCIFFTNRLLEWTQQIVFSLLRAESAHLADDSFAALNEGCGTNLFPNNVASDTDDTWLSQRKLPSFSLRFRRFVPSDVHDSRLVFIWVCLKLWNSVPSRPSDGKVVNFRINALFGGNKEAGPVHANLGLDTMRFVGIGSTMDELTPIAIAAFGLLRPRSPAIRWLNANIPCRESGQDRGGCAVLQPRALA